MKQQSDSPLSFLSPHSHSTALHTSPPLSLVCTPLLTPASLPPKPLLCFAPSVAIYCARMCARRARQMSDAVHTRCMRMNKDTCDDALKGFLDVNDFET